MAERFDVVIVGGRCAGAALAHLTAGSGLKTLVIDRAAFPSDTVSTHSISAHGAELLRQWGLLDEVLATGVPNPRTLHVTIGALATSIPLPDANPGFLAPRRTVLDALLLDAARAAGATVWESTTLVALASGRDGRVTGVRCRRGDGDEVTVAASLVVGADGVRSAVARAVRARSYRVRASNDFGVYAYYDGAALEEPAVGLAERTLALAIPTNDQQVCVAVAVHRADFAAVRCDGDAAVRAVAARLSAPIADAVGRGRRASRFVIFTAHAGHYRTPWGDGWALVGDAGHYSDPFTAQGIANAFLGADLLATALIDGLGGRRPLHDALRDYHHTRDALTGDIHDITHDLAAFDWDVDAGLALFLGWRSLLDDLHAVVAERGSPAPAISAANHA